MSWRTTTHSNRIFPNMRPSLSSISPFKSGRITRGSIDGLRLPDWQTEYIAQRARCGQRDASAARSDAGSCLSTSPDALGIFHGRIILSSCVRRRRRCLLFRGKPRRLVQTNMEYDRHHHRFPHHPSLAHVWCRRPAATMAVLVIVAAAARSRVRCDNYASTAADAELSMCNDRQRTGECR